MDKPDILLIDVLSDVEYQHFDDDPEGDPDRAGDGIYFRIPGDDGWSGPWPSHEQAVQEAINTLHSMQTQEIFAEFADSGYVHVAEIGGQFLFVRAVDDVYGIVQVSARKLTAKVVTADRGNELVHSDEFDGKQRFGVIRMAVRSAVEAIEEEIGTAPSMPRP